MTLNDEVKLRVEQMGDGFYTTDSHMYDGAPDAAPVNSFFGYGKTREESIENFWEVAENFSYYDGKKPGEICE